MKCYTYSSGKLTDGVLIGTSVEHSCSVVASVPYDWSYNHYIDEVRSGQSDIFLYCNIKLQKGDSCNSIFPNNCVCVVVDDVFRCIDPDHRCLEGSLPNADSVFFIPAGSCLLDTVDGIYLHNNNGALTLQKDKNSDTVELTEQDDWVLEL